MRIISGKYKGAKLIGYDTSGTRPTMDRVKESLFGMIQNNVKGAVCLDLFSGTGSLGFEALSNGASKTYFVDKSKLMINFIKKFKDKYNIENVELINSDYVDALKNFKNDNVKFDIIILDPPYNENLISEALKHINNYNLLNVNGIVVCEYEKENIETSLTLIKQKKYGSKNISIYKRTQ